MTKIHKRDRYSTALKEKVSLDALKGEKTLQQIASKNNISPELVRQWKKKHRSWNPIEWARNAETIIGRMYNGRGIPYNIKIQGQKEIEESGGIKYSKRIVLV